MYRVALWLCLIAFASGCGTNAANEKMAPIGGTVSLDDQPLVGATIEFIPINGPAETGGTSVSDAEGKYSIVNHRNIPGVAMGDYKIVVSKWTKKDGTPLVEGESYFNTPNVIQNIPAPYTAPETTPFSVTVTEQTQVPDLKLSSKMKPTKKR
ncbi:MAG: carboxypeptidase-like regulatory domain-containing protein [Bacteroidales bacterium]|nr:carboxypeptidase-like regulatory domain-containing protein [Bacteroidales bacterium]